MNTPADELRAAAKLLRDDAYRAETVSPLPWVTTDEHVIRCGNKGRGIVADRSSEPEEAGDLPYIALMHPGVGLALADWLDGAAADAEQIGADHRALVVARQILAGRSPQGAARKPVTAPLAAPQPLDCPSHGTTSHDASRSRTAPEEHPMTDLTPPERQFLTFALGLAADQMASRGDEFEDDDRAALETLRRIAAGTPDQPTHEGTNPSHGGLTTHRGTRDQCPDPGCGPAAAVWIDGHPIMEAIAAAVHDLCERHDSGLIIDDPRNIAAAAHIALTTHNAAREAEFPDEPPTLPGIDDYTERLTAAIHDVRDRELNRLRQRLALADQVHQDNIATVARIRDAAHLHRKGLISTFELHAAIGPADNPTPADETPAEAHPPQHDALKRVHVALAEHAAKYQTAIERVRAECDRIETAVRANPTAPDFDGAYLAAVGHIRRALDGTTDDETDETPETPAEARPPRHTWRVETRDPHADEWMPSMGFTTREGARERFTGVNDLAPRWDDGTPVERRIVRETTTCTIEDTNTPTE